MQTNIPGNLKANIEQVRPANLSNKDNHLWNDKITVLNPNFTQVSAAQSERTCKLNHGTQPKANKNIYETKRYKVMSTMQ